MQVVPAHNPPVRLLGTMGLVAVIIGTSVSVAATERIDWSLMLTSSLAWSFVPILQLLTGTVLVLPRKRMGRIDALEAYFSTHVPWSLWILGVHALLLLTGLTRDVAHWVVITAAIPAALTVRLLLAFCRERLGMDAPAARRQVVLHQLLSYTLVILYLNFAVALWPRLLS